MLDFRSEIGSRGITRYRLRPDQWQRELKGAQGVKTRREMAKSALGAPINRIISMAYRRVRWFAAPASQDNPADLEAAQFLESCMEDMNVPWETFITQIVLNTNEQGWALFETTYKDRRGSQPPDGKVPSSKFDDGKVGWRHHNLRPASTIRESGGWDLDDAGGWRGIWQIALRGDNSQEVVYIPKEKLLLFRLEDQVGSPLGSGGIFDAAWKPYYFHRTLEEIEGIIEERMGGVLIITLPEDADDDPNDSNSDFSKAQDIVVNFRVHEQMGLVVPSGFQVDLVSPGQGSRQLGDSITRHAQNFFRVALTQFLMLGATQTGSWSLSKDQSDVFMLALRGWLGNYRAVLSGVAVPRLFDLNVFPGITDLPVLDHSPITRRNVEALSNALSRLVDVGLFTPQLPQDEQWIRGELEAPELPQEEKVEQGSVFSDQWLPEDLAEGLGIDQEQYQVTPIMRDDGGLGVVLTPRDRPNYVRGASLDDESEG